MTVQLADETNAVEQKALAIPDQAKLSERLDKVRNFCSQGGKDNG